MEIYKRIFQEQTEENLLPYTVFLGKNNPRVEKQWKIRSAEAKSKIAGGQTWSTTRDTGDFRTGTWSVKTTDGRTFNVTSAEDMIRISVQGHSSDKSYMTDAEYQKHKNMLLKKGLI